MLVTGERLGKMCEKERRKKKKERRKKKEERRKKKEERCVKIWESIMLSLGRKGEI